MQHCLNKRVLLGLGAVALVLVAVKPAWAVAALPLLVLAICPLSMVFMMRGMNGKGAKGSNGQANAGGSCCGSGASDNETTVTSTDKQIADLQEELRILRAQSAHESRGAQDRQA